MKRGAIIGLGNVAVQGHLPGWLERNDVHIVAATDTWSARKSHLEACLPQAHWYDSLDELLVTEQLDFVDICTPPGTHAEIIKKALNHDLHVLCEKPLISRICDLDELVTLAAQKKRVLYTVHNWHQAPIIQKVCQLLQSGVIGEIQEGTWQTFRTKPAIAGGSQGDNWRVDPAMAGGGVLVDHGWHALYVLHSWFGQIPTRLRAQLETRRHAQWATEDTVTIWLEFPTGKGEIFLTWASDERNNRVQLKGTRGSLVIEGEWIVFTQSGHQDSEQRWHCHPALSDGSHHPDWFGGIITGFLEAVSGNSQERDRNLQEASLCGRLVGLAQESHDKDSAWLPVPQPSKYGTF
jgi:predicted dehydrogenase